MSPPCTATSSRGVPLGGPHGGGIARWGRRWTGRIAPSPRSSSRPRETGGHSSRRLATAWCVRPSSPAAGRSAIAPRWKASLPAEAARYGVLAAESDRVESVHDREGRQCDRQRGGELRPSGQPRQLLPQRSEQDPGARLYPVHQAGDRVELAGDQGEPQEGRPPAQDRQPPEQGAADDKHRAYREVGEARRVERSASPALAEPVVLSKAHA